MSGLYPCMHTSKEKVGITDIYVPIEPPNTFFFCVPLLFCIQFHGKNKKENWVKSGNAVRLFWFKSHVKKVSYQRPEVRVHQDVAIVCDSKSVPMDS